MSKLRRKEKVRNLLVVAKELILTLSVTLTKQM